MSTTVLILAIIALGLALVAVIALALTMRSMGHDADEHRVPPDQQE